MAMDRVMRAGIELDPTHADELLRSRPPIDFVELSLDRWRRLGPSEQRLLALVRHAYAVTCVARVDPVGCADGVEDICTANLRALCLAVEPADVSVRLASAPRHCGVPGAALPLPYDEATLDSLSAMICGIQDRLGRRVLLENRPAQVQFKRSTMTGAVFLAAIAERTGCGIRLDLDKAPVGEPSPGSATALDHLLSALPPAAIALLCLRADRRGSSVACPSHANLARAVAWLGPRPAVLARGGDELPCKSLVGAALACRAQGAMALPVAA